MLVGKEGEFGGRLFPFRSHLKKLFHFRSRLNKPFPVQIASGFCSHCVISTAGSSWFGFDSEGGDDLMVLFLDTKHEGDARPGAVD